ncbi:hypothetical protein [Pseudoxanthomonas kaohsiungensis]|uniref:Uncharacterized protein n=1 Tax=Pseudoxanthomonas kaohsiungensis TaxID=283923 RepID=A0ABW3LZV2_9GAMM|nr:hypothetical protein [Pseudoxanthomonas kaohsiungensis]KAF1702917.1 hypothetical protein CSC66_09080 [Pseudoxanthomonas kaohsiungensis]
MRVYDFPNGFRQEAENMFGWLRYEGFTPAWDFGIREGSYCSGITIPGREVEQLHIFQRTNPARWGNPPEVAKALSENQARMKQQAQHDQARRGALTDEQNAWIERVHSETGLSGSAALDLNERLHELAAQHFVLSLNRLDHGLNATEERALEQVESRVQELLEGVPRVRGAKFLGDPRGATVGVVFESGATDSFSGSCKVPLNPERVRALRDATDGFWEALADESKPRP